MVLAGPVKRGQIIPRHFWIHVMDHMKTVVLDTKRPKSPVAQSQGSVRIFVPGHDVQEKYALSKEPSQNSWQDTPS